MKIGTTPTHNFTVPFDADAIKEVEITYCQNKVMVLQKTEADCKISGRVVSVKLSQEDTFKFQSGATVEIQIRLKDNNGAVFASDIMCIACQRCLSSEVL